MRINTIYSSHFTHYGIGYACHSILENMQENGVDVMLHCIAADDGVKKPFYRDSLALWGRPLGYRILSRAQLAALTEWRFKRSFKDGDIAYIWPGTSLSVVKAIKKRCSILVIENINTHQKLAKSILDKEYRTLDMPPNHGIGQENIDNEQAKIDLADYIFCPSDEVAESLINAGVSSKKVIRTSYGLDQKDILPLKDIVKRNNRKHLTAIFVGRIGIRKGVHLLLKSWVKADVKGVLKLVGNIEESARHLVEPFLSFPNIVHIPFVDDLSVIYKDADVFLLPSLEEGSPLVTYLALGAGLPSIVSSMGGGGIIRHDQEGLVIDPHDTDSWAEAIRHIFSDSGLRQKLSCEAYKRAPHYLWNNVAQQRLKLLCAIMKLRKYINS